MINIFHNSNDKYSIKNYYHTFNVKNLQQNPYIEMYIPKLTTEPVLYSSGGGNIPALDPLKKITINSAQDISNENADANDIESIETDFAGSDYWKNVTNSGTTMYGFNSSEGFHNVRNEDKVKFSDKRVQDYFDKCNDLQIFYINKHIEIYELFKYIIVIIKNNLFLNDIILVFLCK